MVRSASIPRKPSSVPNGAPLVEFVAASIERTRERNALSRIVVVAPSLYSAFFLRRAATAKLCDDGGLFNVEFMRIEEVADILFAAAADQPEGPSMTRLIASELIHNAIYDIDTPGPLTRHADNDSTLDAVQRTLQELELLDGGAEAALVQLARGSHNGLYPQLLELQRRYTAFASSYLTREKKASMAAQAVSSNTDLVGSIFGPDIIVVRAPSPPDAYTRLWDALEQLDFSVAVRISPGDRPDYQKDHDFAQSRFYSTTGAADEPRALIRNIMADAREDVKFGEMAVLYSTPDYSSRIKDALDAANIKNCGPSPKTLADTPTGKFVSLFLTMLSTGMRRDAFAAWTTSAPVVNPTDVSRVPAVKWEIVSRNANIASFAETSDWQRSLRRFEYRMNNRADRADDADAEDKTIAPDSSRDAASAASELRRFVSELSNRVAVDDRRSWTEWVDWIDGILTSYHVQSDGPDGIERTGLDRVSAEFDQIRALGRITSTHVDFGRFARTAQRLLRASIGGDSGWGSSVLVAPLSASIGTAFKSVHILGMSEGGLPSPGRSDPLLSDDLRRRLDRDGSWLTTKREDLDHQHREFKLALGCAPSRRLYWNKAILGATNEAYPSPWYVDEILKSRNETNVPVKSLMDPQSDWVESVTTQSDVGSSGFEASYEYEFAIQDVAIRSRNETDLTALLNEPRNRALARGERTIKSRKSAVFGPYDGKIPTYIVGPKQAFSVSASALQTYAECPYRYFMAHELNADERIDPEESLTLSALDKGILVHSILEEFFSRFGVDGSDEGHKHLIDISNEVCDRFLREEYIGSTSIFELERANLLRQLTHWHRNNLDLLDGYEGELMTERRFGYGDDKLGHFALMDGFTLRLRGKIDLIAVSKSSERALVLDFKSGNSSSYTDIDNDVTASGTKLQLPIYSLMAREILGADTDLSAAYWFVFHDKSIRLRPKSPATFESVRKHFAPVIETIVGGIRNGNFPARPGDRDTYGDGPSWKNCKYCAYSDACTTDRLILWNRKRSAPELSDYVSLAEGEPA